MDSLVLIYYTHQIFYYLHNTLKIKKIKSGV